MSARGILYSIIVEFAVPLLHVAPQVPPVVVVFEFHEVYSVETCNSTEESLINDKDVAIPSFHVDDVVAAVPEVTEALSKSNVITSPLLNTGAEANLSATYKYVASFVTYIADISVEASLQDVVEEAEPDAVYAVSRTPSVISMLLEVVVTVAIAVLEVLSLAFFAVTCM